MRVHYLIGVVTALSVGIGGITATAGRGVQLSDGTVYFDRPPTFLEASSTRDTVNATNAGYFFSLSIPADAGEPLETVAIAQRNAESSFREIEFELDESEAFIGTRRQRGDALSLEAVTWDEETQTVSVTFDPAVPPGTDVTIRLEAERNPRRSGVYLFGVTAFPEGDEAYGQFLGYGRLHFYDSGNDSIFESRLNPFRIRSIHRFRIAD